MFSFISSNWRGEPLRLLGVSASALEKTGDGGQIELFARDERARTLRAALDKGRDKLGEASVVPAGSLTHRRALGHVPFGAVKRRDGPTLSREGAEAQVKSQLRRENPAAKPGAKPGTRPAAEPPEEPGSA